MRDVLRRLWSVLVLIAMAMASAHAQSSTTPDPSARPSAPPRPDYRNLRFDEVSTHTRNGDWSDALKAMPIAPHVTLSLGGQIRAREEFVHAFTLTGASDSYALSRTMALLDLQVGTAKGAHARVFSEVRDAQGFSRDLPGGVRPTDADRSDVQNLFGDIGYRKSFVRYGRQEVVSGRERLLGVPDWANTRRGMQGTRVFLTHGVLAIDLLDLRPMIVRQHASNRPDSTTTFRGAILGSAAGVVPPTRALPAAWQIYRLDQRIDATTPTHRTTTGGRLQWALGSTGKRGQSFGVETESALQRGSVGARDIRAWFFTSEISTQWRGVRGTPNVALGLELASGDASPTDNTVGAFNALYGAGHQHQGYADIFGRANARVTQVISTWDPFRRLSLRGAFYHFDRLRLRDGVYTKQATVLRAAGSADARHVGDELDVTANAALTRHLKLIAGGAWIEPGAFMRRSTGGARTSQWGFLGSTYTF